MSRRERSTIVGELLLALDRAEGEGETRLTKAATSVNLPYDRFRDYLTELREHNLVDDSTPPKLTPEGRYLVGAYLEWRTTLALFGYTLDDT